MQKGEHEYQCQECREISRLAALDKVTDPKSPRVWVVCPKCRTPENFNRVCDEDGCTQLVTYGSPTTTGYRSTCAKHHSGW
jgi:hypothetical protein